MRRCPACHALYPEDDRFCEVDGEVLAAERDPVLSAAPTLPVAAPPDDIPILGGARTLLGEGPRIGADRIEAMVRQTIALGRRFEQADLAWQPQPEDFVLSRDGGLALASARGVFRRTGAFDVRPALRALGEALLDAPAARCSTAVVRLLSDPRLPTLSPDEALAILDGGEQLAPESTRASAILAHVGYKRAVQQDAVREQVGDGWTVLVLCDGVSGSSDGGLAARVGSAAACDRASELMSAGESLTHVVRDAILAGHRAVCVAARGAVASAPERHSSRPPGPLSADRTTEARVSSVPPPSIEPPGATIIVAAIRDGKVGIGWAGDSRAYMLGARPELLTQDHSWANAMLATGHVSEEEAFAQPLAYALTRCIGPLDDTVGDLVPDVRVVDLPAAATLVLCSDGVWSYLAKPEAMNAAMRATAATEPGAIARALVHEALLRGGHDNASVAVYVSPG